MWTDRQVSFDYIIERRLELFSCSEPCLVLSDILDIKESMDKIIFEVRIVPGFHVSIQVNDEHVLLNYLLSFVRINLHFTMDLVNGLVAFFDEPLDSLGIFLHLVFDSAHNPVK